jgi:Kef-type K+ transport system membrane component KefB
VLVDASQAGKPLGQLIIAAGSIADFGAIILLSLFFSREATGLGAQLLLLGAFALLVVTVGVALAAAGHLHRLGAVLVRLQDTSTQIRVRGAFLLLVAFAVLAQLLGLEVILGAFLAGAILALLDRDRAMTHPPCGGSWRQ